MQDQDFVMTGTAKDPGIHYLVILATPLAKFGIRRHPTGLHQMRYHVRVEAVDTAAVAKLAPFFPCGGRPWFMGNSSSNGCHANVYGQRRLEEMVAAVLIAIGAASGLTVKIKPEFSEWVKELCARLALQPSM